MTKEEFKPICRKLRAAYADSNSDFLADTAKKAFWLSMLSDLDARKLNAAVDSYIKRERFKPMIADIRNEYDMIEAKCAEYRDRTNSNYYKAMHEYPCYEDSAEAMAIYWQLVNKGGTWKDVLAESERFVDRTKAYVMVNLHRLPTWTEYLRNELRG